jgi:hypothetical protein
VAQVVEDLPSNYKTLSSNPSKTKKMTNEIKEDMYKHLNKFKENMSKLLNEFKEDINKQMN